MKYHRIQSFYSESLLILQFLDLLLTFAAADSIIDNSKNGGEGISSINLVILGIVSEKPQKIDLYCEK